MADRNGLNMPQPESMTAGASLAARAGEFGNAGRRNARPFILNDHAEMPVSRGQHQRNRRSFRGKFRGIGQKIRDGTGEQRRRCYDFHPVIRRQLQSEPDIPVFERIGIERCHRGRCFRERNGLHGIARGRLDLRQFQNVRDEVQQLFSILRCAGIARSEEPLPHDRDGMV